MIAGTIEKQGFFRLFSGANAVGAGACGRVRGKTATPHAAVPENSVLSAISVSP